MPSPMNSISRLVPGLIEQSGTGPTGPSVGKVTETESFSKVFNNLIDSVNDLQHEAGQAQQALMAGEPVELHQVMIKAEEAGLTMDLLLEIRNKLVRAYQEILRMPM